MDSHVDDFIAVVEGVVQAGDRRGRELGFPTANVHDPHAVRCDGVYTGVIQVDSDAGGPSYVTAVSVGHRPTFYSRDAARLLEAHLLDFAGDLYGRHVRIELRSRLRPQRKYVDDRTLVRQLRLDVDATRAWALANDLNHLLARPGSAVSASLAVEGGAACSRPVVRRKKRLGAVRSVERQERREEQIQQALEERGARNEVSPEWLAERIGLPIGYARWYLESLQERTTSV